MKVMNNLRMFFAVVISMAMMYLIIVDIVESAILCGIFVIILLQLNFNQK